MANDPSIIPYSCRLAVQLNHHVFDTLYHAVAFATRDSVLVTADQRYLKKARHLGRILPLDEWTRARGQRS